VAAIEPTAWDALLESLGVVNMPFDVNGVLDILGSVGIDTANVNPLALYEILMSVDWDTYIVTKTSVIDLMTEIGINLSQITETQVAALLDYLKLNDLPVDIHLLMRFAGMTGIDTTNWNQVTIHEELDAIDWANIELNKQWFDGYLA